MKVLITGGCGFVGSHLVEAYLDRPDIDEVVILDNLSTGFVDNLNLRACDYRRVKLIRESILNADVVTKLCKDADIIEHMAANLEVYKGIHNTPEEARLNIVGTLNVLNGAMMGDVKKFHFASSGGVYGQIYKKPADEMLIPEPHWPYGVSKLAAEQYVMQYHRFYDLPATCFRYAIVYGPREWYGRVMTMFIKRIANNLPPVIFGDGEQVRDFVYVKDVVNAHMMALDEVKSVGEIFNIGTGCGWSINNLANLIYEVMAWDVPSKNVLHEDVPEGDASTNIPERIRLEGELLYFVLDYEKAKQVLGWTPKTKTPLGIREEVEWYLCNRGRWDYVPRV